MLLAALLVPDVRADEPRIEIEIRAEVEDVAYVTGTIVIRCLTDDRGPIPCPAALHLIDPLSRLPQPTDDHTAIRTWVHRPDLGESSVVLAGAGQDPAVFSASFQTRLPHRYGDIGYSGIGRRAALYANGGWYPQLVHTASGRDEPVIADLDVTVKGPGIVVLNGAVGAGESHWQGRSDRAALAVLPHGRVHHTEGSTLTVVDLAGPTPTSHPRGRRLLESVAPEGLGAVTAAPVAGFGPVTIVQDTDLSHLARPAPGMVFLSDRSFRIVWLFRPYHARGIRQAMISAATPLPDGWERDFVADAVARSLPTPDLRRALGWLSWNPVVDALLNDGTLPFYADIFAEPFEDDPELIDRLADRTPARAASRQLDDLLGPGAALAEARRMLGQASAAPPDPVPASLRAGWLLRYDRDQDYVIETRDGHPSAIRRDASPGAPAEVVRLTSDGQTRPWLTGSGPDSLAVSGRDRVRIAGANIHQQSRANDRWPPRWDVILAGGEAGLSPTQRNVEFWGELLLRPQGDTRNLGVGAIEHDEQDIVTVSAGYIRAFGPLLNRQRRTEHVLLDVAASYLDPAFRPTESGAYAVGASASWSWETREEEALAGHRFSASVSGGFVPGSADRWAAVGAAATQLFPLSPRQVVAARLKAGWASGDVEHRLLTLGGANDLRSVPEALFLGNEKVLAAVEYRAALFRNAQVPLPLMWLTELQVAPGLELGSAWANDGSTLSAAGATLGVHAIYDALGARPLLAGVTLAAPLWSTTPWSPSLVEAAETVISPASGDARSGAASAGAGSGFQLYIDFSQGF